MAEGLDANSHLIPANGGSRFLSEVMISSNLYTNVTNRLTQTLLLKMKRMRRPKRTTYPAPMRTVKLPSIRYMDCKVFSSLDIKGHTRVVQVVIDPGLATEEDLDRIMDQLLRKLDEVLKPYGGSVIGSDNVSQVLEPLLFMYITITG